MYYDHATISGSGTFPPIDLCRLWTFIVFSFKSRAYANYSHFTFRVKYLQQDHPRL
jgi:hypothetical protein